MIMWHYSNITGFKDRSAYTDFNTKAWQLFVNEFCSMKSLYGTIAYLFFSCHFLFISFLFCPLVILIESTFSCQKMLKLTHNTLVLIVLLLKTLNLHFMLPSFFWFRLASSILFLVRAWKYHEIGLTHLLCYIFIKTKT